MGVATILILLFIGAITLFGIKNADKTISNGPRKIEEFEADFYLNGKNVGEAERKKYSDGSAMLHVTLHRVDSGLSGVVRVTINGQEIGETYEKTSRKGRPLHKLLIQSNQGHNVPEVAVGDVIIVTDGTSTLSAKFKLD